MQNTEGDVSKCMKCLSVSRVGSGRPGYNPSIPPVVFAYLQGITSIKPTLFRANGTLLTESLGKMLSSVHDTQHCNKFKFNY
jgi:hypothetical protein